MLNPKNVISYIVNLYICGALVYPALAQDLTPEKITTYTKADGLSNDYILCIDQDKTGNLWIGHGSGASKFDGNSFTNYDSANGFSDKKVWAILCDSKGYIWFGTKGDGLFRYDGKKWEQFTKEKDGLSSNSFFNGFLYEDNRGFVWGGGSYMPLFCYQNGKVESKDAKQSKGAAEDSVNNLYIVDYGPSLLKFSKTRNTSKKIYRPQEYMEDIAIDENNVIWISSNDYIAKSNDSGISFQRFEFGKEKVGSNCWDLFIDNNNQIWTAHNKAVVRFDGSQFHYYNEKHGLPASFCYYIFQDQQGHLWFACSYGLAKFDNIPPQLTLQTSIPPIVKSKNLSLQFKGDDGRFGSPAEELVYEYKLTNQQQWQQAAGGQVNLENLSDNTQYELQLRVNDGIGNFRDKTVSFRVEIDVNIPIVRITNRDEFSGAIFNPEVTFYFTGEDDRTAAKDLFFKYKLEKDGKLVHNWTEYKKNQSATLKKLKSGDYTFYVRARDGGGNESEVQSFAFKVELLGDKPKIVLSNLNYWYYVDKDNRPVREISPIQPEIRSGNIFFQIDAIDPKLSKRDLEYAFQLLPVKSNWTTYRKNNRYFNIKELELEQDTTYVLKVRAKDKQGIVSNIIDTTFTIKSPGRLPQTQLKRDESIGRGKIVGKFIEFCAEAKPEDCLFSFQIDSMGWSEFTPINCYEVPRLRRGKHTIMALAKNEIGIDPSHDYFEER